MMLLLSVVFGLVPLAGMGWTVENGMITTVDGLFMSIIMLALSGILFLNALMEVRKKFAHEEGAAGAGKRADVATQAATLPARTAPSTGIILPAFTLWWREVVRFYRQPARVVGASWSHRCCSGVVIGAGFGTFTAKGWRTGHRKLPELFLPRRADDDRSLYLDLHHDVSD